MKLLRTPAALLAPLVSLGLAAACSAPFAPARADIFPPAGMNPGASNATLPAARNNLGAGAGNGANVVTDFGADPTGAVDATSAIAAAVAAACTNASPVSQSKEVFIPSGIYTVSATIPVSNGCWIHGQGGIGGGNNAGGTILRAAAGFTSGDLFQFRGFGSFRLTQLRMDVAAFFNGGASYARVHTAGTGYVVNDTITLTGGTFTTATVLKVTAVSAGAVTGSVIVTPGTYSIAPPATAAVAQGSTSGVGINATFDVVYANGAAISLSGPTTTLTADAASGATSLTVASIAGFSNGDSINVEQDDGTYKTTTISGAPSGTTITLAAGLTFKASANHPVYDIYGYLPLIEDVVCRGYWDCLRVENAGAVTVRNFFAQDYGHDGIIKFSGAYRDNGADRYQVYAWDQNRGTSNAGVEFLAGGDVAVSEKSKFLGSLYSVLLNSYFGPTGTLLIGGNSFEESKTCTIRLHQSVLAKEYGNVAIIGNEFSNIVGGANSQTLCVDAGTPNTAPKWIRNVTFSGNLINDAIAAAVSVVSVQDGDNIVVSGNNFNNNGVAGPTAIAVGGAATNVNEFGNVVTGFPTGSYGTMQASSLAPVTVSGTVKVIGATPQIDIETAVAGDSKLKINSTTAGNRAFLDFYDAGGLKYEWGKQTDNTLIGWDSAQSANFFVVNGGNVTLGEATKNTTVVGQKVPISSKTSAYPVVAADSGTHFDNIGAGGSVTFTLPAAAAGLNYCFLVSAAQTVVVTVQTGEKIAVGLTNSAASGNITATAAFSEACVEAHAASQWVARAVTGTWTVN